MSESYSDLGEYTIGDEFPFPYFVFTEKQFNVTTRRFDIVDLDPANYTAIKFSARSENNTEDIDDHALDDIYANLTSDGNGVYHYEWTDTDIDKIGRWTVRIEFERTDTKKFHAREEFFFFVRHKASGAFGDH
jgi:hypothetical protein